MKQYKKNYELKNTAKDRMEGRYKGAILIVLLYTLISWIVRLFIDSTASSTLNSIYSMGGSAGVGQAVKILFDVVSLVASILLGVMNAGIALYFLNISCGQPSSSKDLFYGFRNDSKKALIISAAITLCNALFLGPGQHLTQQFLSTRDMKWMVPALIAMTVGTCLYIPVSLGIGLSFFLMLDFPEQSGKETLQRCWHVMKGNRMRLFLLELSFLPPMLLCVLSFGIGYLWLEPYMQMTYTCFFLDLMNPKEA